MFPLWEVAVAPVLEAAGARRLVEIGALRGENTRQIIDRLGPETELHVIDPLPDFDPAEHEREFAGQYIFHRDLSLNVIGDLPPMDAALIDGDHNWYTVYNELRLFREVTRRHDVLFPLLILHDVGWPYAYRDLYYDPSNIPEEFRHEWRRAGIEPGKSKLHPYNGGLSPTLAHAEIEGGPRNGVYKAVEDFAAEHDRPLQIVNLPIYFGLAIVAEQERLDRTPELAAALDRLQSAKGMAELLEVAEDIRIDTLFFQHNIFYGRERSKERLAGRYLAQMKCGLAETPAARAVLDQTETCMDSMRNEFVLGDPVSSSGAESNVPVFVRAYLEAWELNNRDLWVVSVDQAAGSAEAIRSGLEQVDLLDKRTHFATETTDLPTASGELPEKVSFLHVGVGRAGTARALDALLDRLSHGGFVIIDGEPGAALDSVIAHVRARSDITAGGEIFGPEGRVWRKTGSSEKAASLQSQDA